LAGRLALFLMISLTGANQMAAAIPPDAPVLAPYPKPDAGADFAALTNWAARHWTVVVQGDGAVGVPPILMLQVASEAREAWVWRVLKEDGALATEVAFLQFGKVQRWESHAADSLPASTLDELRAIYLRGKAALAPAVARAVREGQVTLGMDFIQTRLAWGLPREPDSAALPGLRGANLSRRSLDLTWTPEEHFANGGAVVYGPEGRVTRVASPPTR
jgi:hypothetical protein